VTGGGGGTAARRRARAARGSDGTTSDATALTTSGAALRADRAWGTPSLRLWHLILSAGTGDAARLRGWHRLIEWRALATRRERWLAAKKLLKLPARAVREARADVRAFGREVAEHAGVPQWRQLLQLWWLKVRYGIGARTYVHLQLYRPERWRRASEYVQTAEVVSVARFINKPPRPDTEAGVMFDKRLFEAWCRRYGLPAVSTLLEIEGSRVRRTAALAGPLPPRDLFSKPTDSAGGHGARRWIHDGDGGYVGPGGRSRRPDELIAELRALSQTMAGSGSSPRRILLQECLHNHQALRSLTPGGLCTVRLVTYRWPRGAAQLLLGVYKMPTGDSAADNFHFGGVAAPVEVATGRLQRGVYLLSGKVVVTMERHPDTGAVIEGHQLPFWDEAVALVLRAHDTFPRVPVVGWDVALTDGGPVLVEGNTRPTPELSQGPSGVPLGATPFAACLDAHMRECFAR
jgi:hypothetical protein